MRLSVIQKIDELQKQLLGYVGLLSYRYCQMCVKAEVPALLSIEETISGQSYMIEDMAEVYPHDQEDEQQIMDLFPKRSEYIPFIVKGVAGEHPEFRISLEDYQRADDDGQDSAIGQNTENNNENKYVRLTMPDVDKDRRDLIMNYVDAEYDVCKANMSKAEAKAIAEITVITAADDASALDDAKEKVKDVVDEMNKMRDDLTDEKRTEVEDAYERYLKSGGAAKVNAGDDVQKNVGQSLKM